MGQTFQLETQMHEHKDVCFLRTEFPHFSFLFWPTHPNGINDSSCEVVVIFSVVTAATIAAGKFIFSSPISSIFWVCSSKSSEVEVKVLVVLWGTNLSSSATLFSESIRWLIEVVLLPPIRLLLDVCNDESVLIVVGGLVSKTDLSYRWNEKKGQKHFLKCLHNFCLSNFSVPFQLMTTEVNLSISWKVVVNSTSKTLCKTFFWLWKDFILHTRSNNQFRIFESEYALILQNCTSFTSFFLNLFFRTNLIGQIIRENSGFIC